MIQIVKQKIFCCGELYWCMLWKEIIHQIFPEIIFIFAQTIEELEESWKNKSVLVRIYLVENCLTWEDWISKKFYKLPEFFSVFLGEFTTLQEKVGYVLKEFSLYHKTLITKEGFFFTLREKEYKILIHFLHQYQKKVHKEELLQKIWQYTVSVETYTLETHIGQLNKKLKLCNHRILREEDYFLLIPSNSL
ncbi:helix-turn-helix domain-containing protein [Holospora curviuscula]|uniref:DNA-binding transcriptional regulator BasR n=1 Tax=Holospora curviuscula TaxID=1082868 RepID=A0A2S5RE59_9PROT|nr:helix-turn-helix domain-containing protein [Holospora curviuscula]PPE05606.1 DNA-binding transcriptional regulator BasR [Holospora curviuscula]